ncbi:MAG: Holliday junction branch migration protein RuvA [Muribaculaceae bacterium]|nr:Holliday junction branch migration protein RuvA [Muribaculaceae bacterium]MDE6118432.1 Holliday junction branch migration protein RuvA [Muribaculaceae bacterium]MDE6314877.1 Holliday junction branch migration protein RuvA [Muribaculaceae bacterium]
MIEYIKGSLDSLTPTYAIVETGGIGYFVAISLSTFSQIEKQTSVKLLIHEVIREDTHDLYGFADERERSLFRLLIGVSGVGPNTARMILSSLTPAQLEQAITGGDSAKLKAVKGIGLKTAQRIIVDLKDKVVFAGVDGESATPDAMPQSEAFDEALAALVMLGFARPQSQKVLKKLFDSDPTLKVEAAIKRALTML